MPVNTKDFLSIQDAKSMPPTSRNAERSALAAGALRQSGSLPLRVHGESMLPALWPGDVVEIARCSPEDVRPGEIVLALREGRLFLHRLVAHSPSGDFLLQGDSVPAPDPLFPSEALLGRLVRTVEGAEGRRQYAPALSRAMGLLLCHIGLVRRLTLRLHDRRRTSREFENSGRAAELGTL